MSQLLKVKVVPNAKLNRVLVETDLVGEVRYKVYVTQPAEDGKANRAVLKLLAESLQRKSSQLVITSGQTSHNKLIVVED